MKRRTVRNLVAFWVIMGTLTVFSLTRCNAQQTDLSIGGGVMQESRLLGDNLVLNTQLTHRFTRNFGFTGTYTYAFMNNGHRIYVGYTGDGIRQSPPGSKFQQVQLMGLYQFHPGYEDMGIRLNAGIARQISGPIYSTFGIDIHAFENRKFHPYLSWSFVPRGDFGSGEPGWSHTVTVNLAYRIFR